MDIHKFLPLFLKGREKISKNMRRGDWFKKSEGETKKERARKTKNS